MTKYRFTSAALAELREATLYYERNEPGLGLKFLNDPVGVAAEYAWIRHHYPGSQRIQQSLSTLDLPAQADQSGEKIRFDVIEIELADGRTKEIYFDITSFFSGEGTSITDKDGFLLASWRPYTKRIKG